MFKNPLSLLFDDDDRTDDATDDKQTNIIKGQTDPTDNEDVRPFSPYFKSISPDIQPILRAPRTQECCTRRVR